MDFDPVAFPGCGTFFQFTLKRLTNSPSPEIFIHTKIADPAEFPHQPELNKKLVGKEPNHFLLIFTDKDSGIRMLGQKLNSILNECIRAFVTKLIQQPGQIVRIL